MVGKVSFGLMAVGALGLGLVTAQPAARAAVPLPGFEGVTPSSVSGCPHIVWRLVNSPNGKVHGIAYYSDLSGISSVAGTMEKDGKFSLTLTKTSIGNGPVGTVTGTAKSNGHIVAKLVGEGCANNDVNIQPVPNFNTWQSGSGGR